MNITSLLLRLKELGIKVRTIEENLEIEDPNGNLDDQLVELIRNSKQQLLDKLTTSRVNGVTSQVNNIEEQDYYKVTHGQRRFWIIEHLQNDDGINNISDAFEVNNLDLKLLKEVIKQLVCQHESLRTYFIDVDGEPRQKMYQGFIPQVIKDPIVLTNENRATSAVKNLVNKEQKRPFDLSKGPLLRIQIIQLKNARFVVQITMHHIICDGWSLNLLKKEIVATYTSLAKKKSTVIAPLQIQYKDFSAWQNGFTQKQSYNQHKKYWMAQFNLPSPTLDLPFANSRPAVKTYNGGYLRFEFDESLSTQLISFNENKGQTLYMKLVTGVLALLFRYTNQNDITIGTSVSGREKVEFESLIGLFLSTLALRTKFQDTASFYDLIDIVKHTVLNGFAHQSFPFDQLVEMLDLKRDLSRMPLFDIMVELESIDNIKPDNQLSSNVEGEISEVAMDFVTSRFDLVFNFYRFNDKLGLGITYNTDLFEDYWISSLWQHLQSLLKEALINPSTPITNLDYISPGETGELLRLFNKTKIEFPEHNKIHHLFEKSVESFADKTALTFQSEVITYQQLNNQANEIANLLVQQYSILPGEIVALALERSELLPIAILGILKTGAAYLPLNSDLPSKRAEYIISETKARILLTNTKSTSEWVKNFKGTTVDLKTFGFNPNKKSKEYSFSASDSDLAYVMYTSGSTGLPKGVKVNHASVVNFLNSIRKEPGINQHDNLLATTTYIFDISVLELLLPLSVGASIQMTSEEDVLNPKQIIKYLEDNPITIMQATPTFWKTLISSGWVGKKELKILSGGEPITVKLANALASKCGSLWNMYGPTESTIWSSIKRLEGKISTITIGKPIANTQFFILDQFEKLVPKGVNGEICISGAGLSDGYLNRKKETVDKFIDHPYIKGEKLYKTGDIGRWLPNGEIICEGRIDNQVKVRGHRIELEEIENNLLAHQEINDAAVAVKVIHSEKFVTAYYTGVKTLKTAEIRAFLKGKLPIYMIPSYFIHLDKMPITSNGKLNRNALPHPEMKADTDYIPPSNELEKKLVEIWSKTLMVDKEVIGINSSFFELGGHSILAIKLINQLQKLAGINMSLPEFFKDPSISSVVEVINQGQQVNELLPEITNDIHNRYDSFPLTDVQQAYWIGRKDLYEFGNVGTHVYAEAHIIELDIKRFNDAFQQLIERHEMLRMVVDSNGQQRILRKVPKFKAKILDLRELEDKEAELSFYKLRNELSHKVYSGEEWPLFDIRITVFKDNTYKVHYSMDALVMDAGSSDILLQEFLLLYSDQVKEFDPIPISFRDYVKAETAMRLTGIYEKSKSYWMSRISSIPLAPELPIISVEGGQSKSNFERYNGHLGIDAWEKLQLKARNLGITPTILLVGCFAQVLKKWSKTPHFTLNLTLFNRVPYHDAVDQLIGDFTSLTLLEIDVREQKVFVEQLKAIQNRLWEDLEHKHFSGIEVQREMSRQHGHTVTMPVVITSTLGLGNEVEDKEENVISKRQPIQEDYAITQTPQVWLDFQFEDDNEGLWFNWDSIEGLFPAGMINQMFSSFKELLSSLVTDENLWNFTSVISLPDDQLQIRQKINATFETPSTKLLHELFFDQASLNPEKTALICANHKITYGALNHSSLALAEKLKKFGAVPNQLIAVVMEKGWEQVVATMGILYSGAAYLPIAADLPVERVLLLVEQGEVDIILTTPEIEAKINFPKDKKLVVVREELFHQPISPHNGFLQLHEDLAYVIFTSGSTGIPKGVMIDHQGAVNTILDINKLFNVTADDSVLAISSLSFDLSVYDIFGLLGAGGTVVIPKQDELRSPDRWINYIQDYKITLWNTVPALMQMLVDYNQEKSQLTLRLVLLSGDWIPLNLPDSVKALNEHLSVISLGGATEASIWSIFHPIDKVEANWKSIPYGKPLKNQQFQVLDSDLCPCPIYVPGHLYIGGIGLAKGYWKDAKKTAASFITNPETGEKLYKTGDLGRYLEDGNIEFLGREDNQVKIRGYRIELGEIESRLESHFGVKESTVVATNIGNNQELVAYVVAADGVANNVIQNVGSLISQNLVIDDERERLLFKMERRGIRRLQNVPTKINLSKPKEDTLFVKTTKEIVNAFTSQKLSLEGFGEVFKSMMPKNIDGYVMPKYYYPSAGSLYPVQLYISIFPECIPGIVGGNYYYNPDNHRLEQISTITGYKNTTYPNSNFILHLVSDLNAIRPMYGGLAEMFSYQEAGYMSNLLQKANYKEAGLKELNNVDETLVNQQFELGADHLILLSFAGGRISDTTGNNKEDDLDLISELTSSEDTEVLAHTPVIRQKEILTIDYLSRKSYRSYEGVGTIDQKSIQELVACLDLSDELGNYDQLGIRTYMFVKENTIEGLSAGVYSINFASNEWHYLSDAKNLPALFKGNMPIYQSSHFGLILTFDTSNVSQLHNAMSYSGYIGQNIMNKSTNLSIGTCAIGTIDTPTANEVFKLDAKEEVLHCFLGGKVSKEQILEVSKYESKVDSTNIVEELKVHLGQSLPDYMIPKYFVQIPHIPLTTNGKVNKKALPKPEIDIKRDFISPRNEEEHILVKAWSEVLKIDVKKISMDSSFFELGGDSIMAIKLTNQIQEMLGVKLSLPDFFRNPSIAGLTSSVVSEEPDGQVLLPTIKVDLKNRNMPFALTDVQQAYWIGRKDIFDFGNVGTHGYTEYFFRELDVDKFNKALQKLIERHEMLRMVVTNEGEQRILKEVPLYEVEVLDFRTLPELEATKLFYKRREELSHQVFEGDKWPLFDIRVTIFNDQTYKLHYSMDALIMDVGSSIMLSNEFLQIYENPALKFEPISISFREYIQSEAELKKTALFKKSMDYWHDRIGELPLAPEIPRSSLDNKSEKPNFERQSAELDKKQWSKLQDKAKSLGVTPSVLLIGSFAEVLNRWSKTSHFTLNLTLFNRIPFHADVDKLIGDFTSLTLLEVDYREKQSFSSRLKALQARLWEDLEHKYFSGVEVQREMSRHHGHTVTIPFVITSTLGLNNEESDTDFENEAVEQVILDELQEPYSITQTPQVWIDFQLGEYNGGLWYNWDSIEGLFDTGVINAMFSSYEKLLNDLVSSDTKWDEEVLVLPPKAQLSLQESVNATFESYPTTLLHGLFQKNAKKYPEKLAVVTDDYELNYSDLNKMSQVLGTALRKLGAVPNHLVGVVMTKGWEQVVGSLGILYSGAAYLPIAADLPEERIKMLLDQGSADIVVTTPTLANQIKFPDDKKLILVHEGLLDVNNQSDLVFVQQPGDLAYVIFTSGSTGIPKGVMIDHQGAVNTILDINERFNVIQDDSVLAISSLSFDLSVYDIFGILSAGGTIIIPKQHELRSPDTWIDYIKKYNITIWNTVPALMQMLVDFGAKPNSLSLRLVLLSGDWIPVSLPQQIKLLNEEMAIISLGGATEASIWSIYYPILSVEPSWKSIPYGKPLGNQQFYVLKSDLSPCPEHVIGDLYIGGVGLAKGYWGDAEKTASSFIIDPKTNRRLYRTGDMGRYLPDGNIEFLGREDNQVKIQGYRIELGEIEEAIKSFEYVKEAAVITTGDGVEAKRLIAYVTPNVENNNSQDSVGVIDEDESTILMDAQEKAIFKLAGHGIRNLVSPISIVDLFDTNSNRSLQIKENEGFSYTFDNQSIELNALSALLEPLRQFDNPDMVLPKYFYPSAGSLYPVQTYVYVGQGSVQGVGAGYYYYNPKSHRLELMTQDNGIEGGNSLNTISLYLVTDLDAIAPLYGNLAREFSEQEAGYISNLLLNNNVKDAAWIATDLENSANLRKRFELKSNHQILLKFKGGKIKKCDKEGFTCYSPFNNHQFESADATISTTLPKPNNNEVTTFSYLARKSYRTYADELVTLQDLAELFDAANVKSNGSIFKGQNLVLYLLVKENKVEGLKEGFYRFNPRDNNLLFISHLDNNKSFFEGNDWIYNRCGFSVFLVDKKASRNSFLGGFVGQSMMVRATQHLMGLCAIGGVNKQVLFNALQLESGDEVINSWLGGKITNDQLESIEEFKQDHNETELEEAIKEHLSNRLPGYMIPAYFVPIEKIPLSRNGKLDKKALPAIEIETSSSYDKPETTLEKLLVKIWSEILDVAHEKIGVNTNFFELGGDSMKVIKLHKCLKDQVSPDIKVQSLFDHQSIKTFLEAIQLQTDQLEELEEEEVRHFDF